MSDILEIPDRDAQAILGAVVPGTNAISRSELHSYIARYRATADEHHDEPGGDTSRLLAFIAALVRLGRIDAAGRAATREGIVGDIERAGADPCVTSIHLSVVAEAQLLAGRVAEAARTSRLAVQFGEIRGDSSEARHALSLLAAAQALNGEIETAESTMSRIFASRSRTGADRDERGWPLALAASIVGSRRPGIKRGDVPSEPGYWLSGDVIAKGLGVFEECLHARSAADIAALLDACEVYRHKLDYVDAPPLFSALILGEEAQALLRIGLPGKILTLLDGQESLPDHAVCFDLLRASAHIQLGSPQKALDATARCVKRSRPVHSIGTLSSVLLRRAVAYELLGYLTLADTVYSRALHLASRESEAVPPVGLPREALDSLWDRLKENEPEFARGVSRGLSERPALDLPALIDWRGGSLSKREMIVAERLAEGKTLLAISEELCLSVNTLKTQARSIYRKLGVSSREEAVENLRRVGFFV